MKKLFFLIAFSFLAITTFAQSFTLQVNADGLVCTKNAYRLWALSPITAIEYDTTRNMFTFSSPSTSRSVYLNQITSFKGTAGTALGTTLAAIYDTISLYKGYTKVSPSTAEQQDTILIGLATQSAINTNLMLHQVTGSGYLDFNSLYGKSYHSFLCQIISTSGISAGAIIFEGSNNGTTWNTIAVKDESTATTAGVYTYANAAITIAASVNKYYSANVRYRYVRCRISTAFVGGTVQAITTISKYAF